MANLSNHLLKRKTFPEIQSSLEESAIEQFGNDINLSEQGPLGMLIQAFGWDLSIVWEELENSYLNGSLLTATGQNLDFVINSYGRFRFDGIKATGTINITGNDDTVVEKGFRVATRGRLIFETLEDVTIQGGVATVGIQALQIGTEYNLPPHTITEIVNPVVGVDTVSNSLETKNGANIETDSAFRARQYLANIEPITGSNAATYRQWALDVKGVGNVKVLPITPMPGFTTLIIVDVNNQPASPELVQEVIDYITPLKDVNAGLYVYAATSKDININAKVVLLNGYNLQDVQNAFYSNLQKYFSSISLDTNVVSYAQIGRVLLETEGIADYTSLTLNGQTSSISLEEREVPVLKTAELEV